MSRNSGSFSASTAYRESNENPDSDIESENGSSGLLDEEDASPGSSTIFLEANQRLLNVEGRDLPLSSKTLGKLPAMVQQPVVLNASAPVARATGQAGTAPTPAVAGSTTTAAANTAAGSTGQVLVAPVVPTTTIRTAGTANDLPVKGSREAPKTFKGRYSEVEDFINHFEKLLAKHGIVDEKEKCEGILTYCSSTVKGVVRCSQGFRNEDWDSLKQYMLKLYDAERARQRYLPHDVYRFSQRSALRSVTDLSDWLMYCRRYQERAGGLRKEGKISEIDYRMHFWHGIPGPLRVQLEDRLWRAHPRHDIQQYFPIEDVSTEAEQLFHRNKFTTLHAPTPLYGPGSDDEDSDETSSDSDSDSSSSDRKHRIRKGRKRRKTHRRIRDSALPKREENVRLETKEHVTRPQGTADEVQDIIRQLGALRVDDSAYPALYYKALQLDSSGLVEKCVRPYTGAQAEVAMVPAIPYAPPATTVPPRSPYSSPPFPPRRSTPGPPTFGKGNTNARAYEARMEPNTECFGCGVHGHKMHECGVIQPKLQMGEIVREPSTNRYIMADGEWIRRNGNECLAAAVDRILENRRPPVAGKSLLVKLKENVRSYLTQQEPGDESDVMERTIKELASDADESDMEGNEWEEEYWHEHPEYENEDFSDRDLRPLIAEDDPSYYSDTEEELTDSKRGAVYLGKGRAYAAERVTGPGRGARLKAVESPREAERPKRIIKAPLRADGTRAPSAMKRPDVEKEARSSAENSLPRSKNPSNQESIQSSKNSTPPQAKIPKVVEELKQPLPSIPATEASEKQHQDVEMEDTEPLKLKPVSARQVRFRKPLIDESVKEIRREAEPVETRRRPERVVPSETTYSKRTSELTSKIDKGDVLRRILDAPVTMPIREVLGSSGDLCRGLLEMIKLRNPNPQVMTVSQKTNREVLEQILHSWLGQSRHTAGNGQLIRIPLINNGHAFEGILDTGSELNVVSSRLSDLGITGVPVDITQGTRMSDANGGEGRLTGVIENMGMKLGSLKLAGDFFVGERVPFDALLGRPWQTRNRVSIDERPKGTYLVFKDKEYQITHEMLVVPSMSIQDLMTTRPQQKSFYMSEGNSESSYPPSNAATHGSPSESPTIDSFSDWESAPEIGESFEGLFNSPINSCPPPKLEQQSNSNRTNAFDYVPPGPSNERMEDGSEDRDPDWKKNPWNPEEESALMEFGLCLARLLLSLIALLQICLNRFVGRTNKRMMDLDLDELKATSSSSTETPTFTCFATQITPPRTSQSSPRPVPGYSLDQFIHSSPPLPMEATQPAEEPDFGHVYVKSFVDIPPDLPPLEKLSAGVGLARSLLENPKPASKTTSPLRTISLGSPTILAAKPRYLSPDKQQLAQDFILLDLVASISPAENHVVENLVTGSGILTMVFDGPTGRRNPAMEVPSASLENQIRATHAAFPLTVFASGVVAQDALALHQDFPPNVAPATRLPMSSSQPISATEDGPTANDAPKTVPLIKFSQNRLNALHGERVQRGTTRDLGTDFRSASSVNNAYSPDSSSSSSCFRSQHSSERLSSQSSSSVSENTAVQSLREPWMDKVDLRRLVRDLAEALQSNQDVPRLPTVLDKPPVVLLLRKIEPEVATAGPASSSSSPPPSSASPTSSLSNASITIDSPAIVIPSELSIVAPTLMQMLNSEPQLTQKLLEQYPGNETTLVEEVRRFQRTSRRRGKELHVIAEESESEGSEGGKRKLRESSSTMVRDPLTQRPSREQVSGTSVAEDSDRTLEDDPMSISSTPARESFAPTHSQAPETDATEDDMPELEVMSDSVGSSSQPIEIEDDSEEEGNETRGRASRVVLPGPGPLPPRSETPAPETRRARPLPTVVVSPATPVSLSPGSAPESHVGPRFQVLPDGTVRSLHLIPFEGLRPVPQSLITLVPPRGHPLQTPEQVENVRRALNNPDGHLRSVWRNIPNCIPICGHDLTEVGSEISCYVKNLLLLRCIRDARDFIMCPSLGNPRPLMPKIIERINFFSALIPGIAWAVQSHKYASGEAQSIRYRSVEIEQYIHPRQEDPQLAPVLSPMASATSQMHYEAQHCFTRADPRDARSWYNQVVHVTLMRKYLGNAMEGLGEYLTQLGLQEDFKEEYVEVESLLKGRTYCALLSREEQRWFLACTLLMERHGEHTAAIMAEKILERRFEDEDALEYLVTNRHIFTRDPASFPCVESFTFEDYVLKKGLPVTQKHHSKPTSHSRGHFLLDEPNPEHPIVFQGFSFASTVGSDQNTREDFSGLIQHFYPNLVVPVYRLPAAPYLHGSTHWVKMVSPPSHSGFADATKTHRLSAIFGGEHFVAPETHKPWLHRTTSMERPPLRHLNPIAPFPENLPRLRNAGDRTDNNATARSLTHTELRRRR